MRPAARPVRRAWAGPATVVLLVCAGLLAACSGTTLPFSKGAETASVRTPPAIVVSSIAGLPADRATALFDALVNAAAVRGIGLGRREVEGGYVLAGEFEALAGDSGTAVRYRWTLTDETGRVLHRIEETQAVPAAAEPAATGFEGMSVLRVAAFTAESLSSRLSQLGFATRAAGMPPPLDTLAEAGPGAEQEIDFETLNGPGMAVGEPPMPQQSAQARVPVEPQPGPASADNSIQGVAITGIEGAGPAGNSELARALARVLTDAGWPVVQEPRRNVLRIEGDVTLSQPVGKAQKVALRWTVKAPDGQVLGAIDQANDVPAGSLDNGWGDAADHAALAAAQGIFDLVDKLR